MIDSPALKRGESAPIMFRMDIAKKNFRRGLLVLPVVAALTLPGPADAAKLRPVENLRVVSVSTGSIDLRWQDRSRGESGYQLGSRTEAGSWAVDKAKRGSTAATIAGPQLGTVYKARVRACKGKRCAPWGKSVSSATLLAPINGPHPDPGCSSFPASDEFNRNVSAAPLATNSDQVIAQINADGGNELHPDFGSNPKYGLPYVVVPSAQPMVPIDFGLYGDESDTGPYPVPPGAPVEGGSKADGDRHVLVVRQPATPGGSCDLFELYRGFEKGDSRNRWRADSGSIFDLGTPLAGQRPDGWTSADAAGLPIYPGLVTYEEVQSGVIDHAIRITFDESHKGYLSPATHYASDSCNPDRPPMGLRLRLQGGYDLSGFSGDANVIATALKQYGVINADNGSNWFITGSTDRRWDDENLNQLKDIPGSAFEVVASGPETTPC
jgi:hypothetical protein